MIIPVRIISLLLVLGAAACGDAPAERFASTPSACKDTAGTYGVRSGGYRGIWYRNQPLPGPYGPKYSGGLATFPQQHVPLAVHVPQVQRTFFVYGGQHPRRNHVQMMVSYYDHRTNSVPRPVNLLDRATFDAHYNPTLAVDRDGYVYVFANSHGPGFELSRDDTTYGKAYVFRSTCPYSVAAFRLVRTDLFSYSQTWGTPTGLLWFHTRYEGQLRHLYWSSSADGKQWSAPRMLSRMGRGNYQVSWAKGDRVGTAFNYHPREGALNARTNLYYLQTQDLGASWRTASGEQISPPLTDVYNPALVRDYEREGSLVYIKDLKFDADGHPIILYLTTRAFQPGPDGGPRVWHTARWTGSAWDIRAVAKSDHNYDHGSLYIEPDGTWRIIAPLLAGAHPFGTGGSVVAVSSRDQGRTWEVEGRLRVGSGQNQSYVRGPLNAHPGFYAFWADGDVMQPSASSLYFANRRGEVFRLPSRMQADRARPDSINLTG